MSQWLIAAVGIVYLATALLLWREGKLGLAVAFVGYALGNAGLYIAAK